MCGNWLDIHFCEDRSAGCRHDDVVRSRRNAHAEDYTAEHGEEQCDYRGIARNLYDGRD